MQRHLYDSILMNTLEKLVMGHGTSKRAQIQMCRSSIRVLMTMLSCNDNVSDNDNPLNNL